MDEIFGRDFFLTKISWQRAADTTVLGQGETPVNDVVEYILVYGSLASLRKIFRKSTEVLEKKSFQQYHQILKSIGTKKLLKEIEIGNNGETAKIYLHKNWEIENISLAKFDQRFEDIYKKYKDNFKKIIRLINPQKENSLQQRFLKEMERDNFYSVEYTPKKGKNRGKLIEVLYYKKNIVYFLKDFAVLEKNDIYKTFPMNNFWPLVDIPATGIAKEGGIEFKRSKKPEKLIKRILEIATEKDDIVLDSFAGSGTTGAVAHKMGRRWLMVEIGRQAEELIIPRLQGVIKGNDQTGVSKEVGWQGGGGFKYYKLGESVIHEQDMNWALKAEEMAEAVFLHFQYRPVKAEWLKKENMYLGRHQFARFHFALSFATREVKVLTEDLYEKIIAGLDKEKFKHLTIFTNVALAVPPESLDDRVLVKKIPAAILREYNLL
jgi:adenine-specific DNA-methyltransferase